MYLQNFYKGDFSMKKLKMLLLAMMFMFAIGANAAPTDFASALPSTLIPDGFWGMVQIVFLAVAAVWGVTKGIRLFKKA